MEITLEELARKIGAELRGDGSRRVRRCIGLEEAGEHDLSFLANRRYIKHLATTQAAAVVLSPNDVKAAPDHLALLISSEPYFAFRNAVVAIHGFRAAPAPAVSPQAVIDPTAQVAPGCYIGPFVVIAAHVRVGEGTVIYPHTYVGERSVIGRQTTLFSNVAVYHDSVIGDRVCIHSGCVIGQDGFGYATRDGIHHKIPQIGNVVIEDDVELGAGCTIDRATLGSTRIGRGSKFSDQIAIGHGSQVGPGNLLVAQVGLAGSVRTGQYVAMGGQAGVAGHLHIGDFAQIAAKAGVMDDVPPNAQYGGQPAIPMADTKRSLLALMRLPDLLIEFRRLQKRVAELEKNSGSGQDTQ